MGTVGALVAESVVKELLAGFRGVEVFDVDGVF